MNSFMFEIFQKDLFLFILETVDSPTPERKNYSIQQTLEVRKLKTTVLVSL